MMKYTLIYLFTLALSFSFTSCNQCIGPFGKEKIVCDNGGTCNDGECDCLKGYTGETCSQVDLCELNDVVCVYGDCVEGDCICDEGYEDESCNLETRAKFIGTYRVDEEGCAGLDTFGFYDIEIERNLLNGTGITISNMFNAQQFSINGIFSDVDATVQTGSANFNIFNQSPDDNDKSLSGSGSIDFSDSTATKLSIQYEVIKGNKQYSCFINAVKVE